MGFNSFSCRFKSAVNDASVKSHVKSMVREKIRKGT